MTGAQVKAEQLASNTVEPSQDSRLTSDFGTKQSNTDDWLRVASDDKTGPSLLEDAFAREKIHRFDHERIPERVVHARGAGAFGTFRLLESAADVTHAGVLTDTSRQTPVFVRFSTVLGSRGSADTVRDVRGFAVKMYTDEGNWDIVGNNIPVFFIQDAIKFPDLIHAGKPEPTGEIPQAQTAHNNFWDFMFLHPEATHMFMWASSDRAIPRSYRMMQGFGVNTFTLVNEEGKRHFVKFHFTPALGVHSLVWDEALKIAGQDPDFHRKDLMEAIDAGAFPKWRFGIQTIAEGDEDQFEFDVLDATKVWPEDLVPIRYVGELELNRNVDEYFTETEQVAFCTSHVVPGVGFSDDPLLQGRNFSYFDTQISRLGINWEELPINKPVCPMMNFNRDGAMRHRVSKGKFNYWPNRGEVQPPATVREGGYQDFPQAVRGVKVRDKSAKFKEHIAQAQLFYNSLAEIERQHLRAALAFELDHCDDPVVYSRVTSRLAEIDADLGAAVAKMVGGEAPAGRSGRNHGRTAPGLSQLEYQPETATIESRKVAILIADGYDGAAFTAMLAALKALKAVPVIIAPRRSAVFAAGENRSSGGGGGVVPDHHLEGQRSTLFDALFIPGGHDEQLVSSGRAVHYVREAFGHLKTVAATGEAGVRLLDRAIQLQQIKLSEGAECVESYGVVSLRRPGADGIGQVVRAVKNAKGFLDQFVYAASQHRCWERELDGLTQLVAY